MSVVRSAKPKTFERFADSPKKNVRPKKEIAVGYLGHLRVIRRVNFLLGSELF
jgi:hypothetical protein